MFSVNGKQAIDVLWVIFMNEIDMKRDQRENIIRERWRITREHHTEAGRVIKLTTNSKCRELSFYTGNRVRP